MQIKGTPQDPILIDLAETQKTSEDRIREKYAKPKLGIKIADDPELLLKPDPSRISYCFKTKGKYRTIYNKLLTQFPKAVIEKYKKSSFQKFAKDLILHNFETYEEAENNKYYFDFEQIKLLKKEFSSDINSEIKVMDCSAAFERDLKHHRLVQAESDLRDNKIEKLPFKKKNRKRSFYHDDSEEDYIIRKHVFT